MRLAFVALLWLAAPGMAAEFTSTRPVERVDYWQQRAADITAQLRGTADLSPIKLVFIGDSITDFWHLDANPWFKGKWCGKAIWDESFAGTDPTNRAINLGVSGDRIEHLLHRLQPRAAGGEGTLDRPDLDPDFIVMMVGINNSFDAEEPAADSIFAGVRATVAAAHARKPRAIIILQSLLPTDDAAKNRDIVDPVNARLKALAAEPAFGGAVVYLDLHHAFVDNQGKQISRYFNDGLHPSRDGYRVWRDKLVPFLAAKRSAIR